jgi:hypothetical protein
MSWVVSEGQCHCTVRPQFKLWNQDPSGTTTPAYTLMALGPKYVNMFAGSPGRWLLMLPPNILYTSSATWSDANIMCGKRRDLE